MNTLLVHEESDTRLEKFNGPILDHEKLRQGTQVALLTAAASIVMVLAVKVLYLIF